MKRSFQLNKYPADFGCLLGQQLCKECTENGKGQFILQQNGFL